jgi:hypothetical protein
MKKLGWGKRECGHYEYVALRDLDDFRARLEALGMKSSGTFESMEPTKKELNTYTVTFVPRRPKRKLMFHNGFVNGKPIFIRNGHSVLVRDGKPLLLNPIHWSSVACCRDRDPGSNKSTGVLLVKAGINQRLREFSRFLNLTGSRDEINKLLDAHSGFLHVVVAVLLWRIVYALMQS